MFVNGKRTAFIQRFSNQWALKALNKIASPIHKTIHTCQPYTDANHAGRQPVGVSRLAQGHHGGAGVKLATFQLAVDPLYLLSHS